jgi:hypothetical protein
MDVDTPTAMDVHVECVQQRRSLSKLQDVCSRVLAFLCETLGKGLPGTAVKDFLGDAFLAEHVEELYIAPLHDSASRQVGSNPPRRPLPQRPSSLLPGEAALADSYRLFFIA